MSFMFEVYYKPPVDKARERNLAERVARFGGRVDYREEPAAGTEGAICVTFEFPESQLAENAASALRSEGEHVEGPVDYGP